MTTEAEVFRFVPTAYVRVSKETQARATKEADAYKFMRLGNRHYACAHEKQAYVIIEKDGKIGCSCHAMVFNCTGNEVCKHIVAFQNLKNPPAAKPTSAIMLDLLTAGWRKNEHDNLYPPDTEQKGAEADEREKEVDSSMDASWNKDHPETEGLDPMNEDKPLGDLGVAETTSDEEGNDNEGSDPTPEEPPKREPVAPPGLGEKVFSRTCPHCDERIEGTDLDDVKRRHREHITGCPENPANKATDANTATVEPEQKQEEENKMAEQEEGEMHDTTKERVKDALDNMPIGPEKTIKSVASKTYAHPDGAEFDSAEQLLDYVDMLKEGQATDEKKQQATSRRVQHNPMIKGISPRLQEIGRIAVGEKGGRSKSGKTLLPTKLDHFIFTTLDKDDEDRYIRDPGMMELFGDNCTEIPVRLLYNDIELNFPTFYAKYAKSGIKLRGDGENWTVYGVDAAGKGTREEVFDPNNEKGFLDDQDVKPHGILSVLVEGQNSVGGVFKFRTTSWNSINNILSSLAMIKNMCGMLTYIPLKLVLRKKEVQPVGMAHKTWIPVVSVEFRGSIEELQTQAIEVRRLTSGTQREEMRQIEAAVRDHLDEDETIEVQKDIASEFTPGVV